MAGDRVRRARADLGADRLGQDAGRVPVGDRPPDDRAKSTRTRVVYVSPLKALATTSSATCARRCAASARER